MLVNQKHFTDPTRRLSSPGDPLSLFGFGGQDARNRLFVRFFLRSLSEAASEFVIAWRVPGY